MLIQAGVGAPADHFSGFGFRLAFAPAFLLDFPNFISSCGFGGMRTIAAMILVAISGAFSGAVLSFMKPA
jgi:hypothetical protein